MAVIKQLLENRILWIGVLSWFVAQATKVVLTLIVEKRLDWSRMTGLGGMPSSHTSVVVSVTVAVGSREKRGTALDVDGEFRLVLRDEDGSIQTLNCGEVTRVRMADHEG